MAHLDKEEMNMIKSSQAGLVLPVRFITIQRLSEISGVPERTLYKWRQEGWLRATTLDDDSSRILVDLDHFNAVLDSRLREEVAHEETLTNE